jgi:phospholipid/cholesterol/gamma-HCH transport system ATP-binding protein
MAPFVAACKRHGVPVAGADRIAIQPEVAVRDIMALLAFLARSGKLPENAEETVERLLDQVGIREYAEMYPSELAVGVKRAVAIARALAADPEAVLYDEPTTMVDPHMSVHMMALIARLNREMKLTSVIVTHDLELMRQVADDVVILHEGRAIYFGPVGEIERNEHPHIQEFLSLDRMAAEVE